MMKTLPELTSLHSIWINKDWNHFASAKIKYLQKAKAIIFAYGVSVVNPFIVASENAPQSFGINLFDNNSISALIYCCMDFIYNFCRILFHGFTLTSIRRISSFVGPDQSSSRGILPELSIFGQWCFGMSCTNRKAFDYTAHDRNR